MGANTRPGRLSKAAEELERKRRLAQFETKMNLDEIPEMAKQQHGDKTYTMSLPELLMVAAWVKNSLSLVATHFERAKHIGDIKLAEDLQHSKNRHNAWLHRIGSLNAAAAHKVSGTMSCAKPKPVGRKRKLSIQ